MNLQTVYLDCRRKEKGKEGGKRDLASPPRKKILAPPLVSGYSGVCFEIKILGQAQRVRQCPL